MDKQVFVLSSKIALLNVVMYHANCYFPSENLENKTMSYKTGK